MRKIKLLRIFEELPDGNIICSLQEDKENVLVDQISIAHDYVRFTGPATLVNKDGSVFKYTVLSSITIGIYDFCKWVLPYLNQQEYLKPEHALQPCYNNRHQIFQFYDKNKKSYMVAVRLKDETEFSAVTLKFYKQFIEPVLDNE